MVKLTVFTPTYNRGYTLGTLYDSLCKQDSNEFEWVIVDDGSDDDTSNLVKKWINEGNINIRYLLKQNAGKHTAINKGVELAAGKYFLIVDSDDYLVENVVSEIISLFETNHLDSTKYAGISGTKVSPDGTLIGTMFADKEFVDCTTLERRDNNIRGDKAEVFFTDVLRQYPFPVFDGEKFINEAIVWNRIANAGLKIRWFNKPFVICEYLPDGLTSKKGTLHTHNIQGTLLYLEELIQYDNKFIEKVAHRASFCGIAHNNLSASEIARRIHIPKVFIPVFRLIYRFRGSN